ncbi:FtsX-like permease family protein [Sporolactobacillus shoreae]|uniref:FtsX-like permease family protein n=1 Tax=Sporolactobacillus shoreae TaxID=1465501 RepID=A0A4Z0GKR3_9BACL|nr:FtsX-like permease family protein [Sporolactobacillus shoreae]TGA96932.1 FtsX-like permease family protein [Sporolactobacillus shoreae]
MQKTLIKEVFREIKGSLNRFFAILVIVTLGVAFYVGFNSIGPDLSASVASYFSKSRFMDLQILSPVGFNQDDLKAIRTVPGVKNAQPVFMMDAMQTYGKQTNVAHLISIPNGNGSNEAINSLTLVKGRFPKNSHEVVVDQQKNGSNPKIGDLVTLSSGSAANLSDSLHDTKLKVVGTVDSPAYLTRDRGTSTIGNGKVSGLIFMPQQNFKQSDYTAILVTAADTNGLEVFNDTYSNKVSAVRDDLNHVADSRTKTRYNDLVSKNNKRIAQQQNEYNKKKKQADQSFADAQQKIDDSQNKLKAAQDHLKAMESQTNQQFSEAQTKLDTAAKQLANSTAEYNQKSASFQQSAAAAQNQFATTEKQINALSSKISSLQNQLNGLETELSVGQTSGSLTPAQMGSLNAQIQKIKSTLVTLTQQRATAQANLSAQQKKLAATQTQLNSSKQRLADSAAQLNSQKDSFAAAQKKAKLQITQGQQEIDRQKSFVDQARQNLKKQKTESNKKLSKAEQQIHDAKQKVNQIVKPNWKILSRDDNTGYSSFQSTVDRSNGMSSILPVIFFAIAALVCLTTMTRMVQEQRTQIGTLKALGYSNGAIAFKYLFYSASASLIGSIIGMVLGFILLPSVLFKAYMILYSMPAMSVGFHPGIAATALVISLALITAATLFTCISELRSVPSALMRPEPPKSGKRILLERIHFLWNHLSFSKKVTARNLFRYKKRFWMTVLGVACCCAMLVTGLGLKDSISTQVSQREFGEIMKYDMSVQLKNNVTAGQTDTITHLLRNTSGVSSFMKNTNKNITVKSGSKSEQVNRMVPQQPNQFSNYFKLRQAPSRFAKTGAPISLSNDGVVVTQQLAQLLNIKTGDTLAIEDDATHSYHFRVEGIAENYLLNYVFMTPTLYSKAYGSQVAVNQILTNLNTKVSHNSISSSLTKVDGVANVSFLSDSEQTFQDTVKSLNDVVWVIILSAILLEFVVLYTLTTINIGERFREIATIKVLGFYDREVSAYVTRESYLLTLIGIVLGLIGGLFLHAKILSGIEVDGVMFVKSILPQSFIVSALLTFIFTWVVNLMTMRPLRKIDMVEALKGNE